MRIDKFGTVKVTKNAEEVLDIFLEDFEFHSEGFAYASEVERNVAAIAAVCDFIKHNVMLQVATPTSELRN